MFSITRNNRTLWILSIFLVLFTPLHATYLFLFEESADVEKKEALFALAMQKEPPRSLYEESTIDLKEECQKLFPTIELIWIPPSLWQIGALHAFFHEESTRKMILACAREGWDPIEYEEIIHNHLPTAQNTQEIAEYFDLHSTSLPHVTELFFALNKALLHLYQRSGNSDLEMLRLCIREMPPFPEWRARQFPFWQCPWIYNIDSAEMFYNALQDESLLSQLISLEIQAHERGEWVLYRGYDGCGFPSTIEINDTCSHALSFGSTLLGGVFFSMDATALTYAHPSNPKLPYNFLALTVTPHEINELFRIGALHPFLQMLVNGELFHAHTKVAASTPDEFLTKKISGYFMQSNFHCMDPIGYIITLKMTPEELEDAFHALCKKSGVIFNDTFRTAE